MSYTPKTSDAAVKKTTGKTWREWFALLDKAGAKKMPHIEIARLLYHNYLAGDKSKKLGPDIAKSGGWWSQMVTVEYERSRGLRAVNQTVSGYNVSVHGTFPVSVTRLFTHWRKIAHAQGLTESTVRRNQTIRYKAAKGEPRYVVMFRSKGARSSRIGFGAMRLAKAADVEKQRGKWKSVLRKLEKAL
jgi:hypothetical protein